MTTKKEEVKKLCDEVYGKDFQQITIDLVQEKIEEELIHTETPVTRDAVGAAAYDCDILREAMNPKFEIDISLLERLYKALNEWEKEIEFINITLGLPKEN